MVCRRRVPSVFAAELLFICAVISLASGVPNESAPNGECSPTGYEPIPLPGRVPHELCKTVKDPQGEFQLSGAEKYRCLRIEPRASEVTKEPTTLLLWLGLPQEIRSCVRVFARAYSADEESLVAQINNTERTVAGAPPMAVNTTVPSFELNSSSALVFFEDVLIASSSSLVVRWEAGPEERTIASIEVFVALLCSLGIPLCLAGVLEVPGVNTVCQPNRRIQVQVCLFLIGSTLGILLALLAITSQLV